jgi:hypothetical protein
MVKDWSAATSMSPTRLSSSYPKAATPAACATMGSQGASQEEDSSTTSKEELLRSQLFVPSGTPRRTSFVKPTGGSELLRVEARSSEVLHARGGAIRREMRGTGSS